MRRTKLIFVTNVAIAVACFGGVASAQSTPYFSATGGMTFPRNLTTDTGVSGELKDGYAVTGAIGSGFGAIRGEIEASYRRNGVKGASGFGLQLPGTGHASALSAMANAYVDPALDVGPLKPYVGGGVGISRFRATNVAAVGLPFGGPVTRFGPISGEKTGFAWQLMAGVGIALSEKAAITVGYRYFATPSVTVNDVPQFNSVQVNGLKMHAVEAGLRLGF